MPFYVYNQQCDQCLFSKNKIVSNARRKEVLRDCTEHDTHFVCHKATIKQAENERYPDVCCAGFYEANPGATNLMRIAERLNGVRFVKLPDEDATE